MYRAGRQQNHASPDKWHNLQISCGSCISVFHLQAFVIQELHPLLTYSHSQLRADGRIVGLFQLTSDPLLADCDDKGKIGPALVVQDVLDCPEDAAQNKLSFSGLCCRAAGRSCHASPTFELLDICSFLCCVPRDTARRKPFRLARQT